MRLSRLLVVTSPTEADWPLMERVIRYVTREPVRGLPRHMVEGMQWSADLALRHHYVSDYWFVCLFAAQARPGGEPREVIELRRELEQDFYGLLFGGSPW